MRNFQLKWETGDNEFNEVFNPYSFQLLRKMYDWSPVNGEITGRDFGNSSENNELNNLEKKIISNDPENFEEFMFIDYLCEITSVKIMQKYLHINDYRFNDNTYKTVNRVLQSNMHIQITINIIKVDLSILENVDFRTYNGEQEELLLEIVERIVDRLEGDYKYIIDFWGNIQRLRSLGFSTHVIEILDDVYDYINYLDHSLEKDREYFYIKRQVRELLKQIPEVLGGLYKERFEVLRGIVRHSRLWSKIKQTTLVKMAISERKYNEERLFLEDAVVMHMRKMVNKMIVPSDLNEKMIYCEDKLKKLEKFFNENILNDQKIKGLEKWIRKRYSSDSGCFGIMELHNNKNYFSLSGAMDYAGTKWKVSENKQFDILKNIIQSLPDFKNYIYSPMTDDILRYKEDTKGKSYLPISLENDIEGDFDKIKEYYSCCERKMQAKSSNYDINKVFYARWEPCDKCIPALAREKKDIRIFALAKNYNDWKDNKSKFRECDLSKLIAGLRK